jgi:hypothetical protein
MGMFITPEDLKQSATQIAPADSISIIRNDDGMFFMLILRKGKNMSEAKKIMCDDVESLIEFMRGFFPATITTPVETPKNSPENFQIRQEIGFLNKAA